MEGKTSKLHVCVSSNLNGISVGLEVEIKVRSRWKKVNSDMYYCDT